MILPGVLIVLFQLAKEPVSSETASHFFTWQTLTIIASIVSILSFFLTIFVLYDTRRLRSYYKFKVRGPTLIRELRSCSKKISDFLNEFDAFIPQISEELGRAAAKLHSLERKLKGPAKAATKRLRKRISTYRVHMGSEDEIREIYIEMVKVVEEVRNYQRDSDWER